MRKRGCLGLLCVAALGFLFTATAFYHGFSPLQAVTFWQAPSLESIPTMGQPVVDELLRYRKAHGRFPESLDMLEVSLAPTFYGNWRYRMLNDGSSCSLSLGDYGRYQFEVSWSPEHGWYTDT